MPRRFFRKFAVKQDFLRRQWWLAPFAGLLHDPYLWGIRRRTVVPAFAVGLFVAYLPFPGHMLIAALLALWLRVNIPVAVAAVWTSNPLTMGPMYYAAYELGQRILGEEKKPFIFEMSFDWLISGFLAIWQPLILGCLILGLVLSFLGYVILDLAWRASISDYLAQRRNRRRKRQRSGDD